MTSQSPTGRLSQEASPSLSRCRLLGPLPPLHAPPEATLRRPCHNSQEHNASRGPRDSEEFIAPVRIDANVVAILRHEVDDFDHNDGHDGAGDTEGKECDDR